MAGADDAHLLHASYERRRREMESVANALTEETLNYWSQNTGLRVLIDMVPPAATEGSERQAAEREPSAEERDDELHIRLWDARHFLSLPFDQRSSGFRWFFSFLAAFAQYESAREPMIILLDEPALGLHARAQQDFLRFINERLAVNGNQALHHALAVHDRGGASGPRPPRRGSRSRCRLGRDVGWISGPRIRRPCRPSRRRSGHSWRSHSGGRRRRTTPSWSASPGWRNESVSRIKCGQPASRRS
jgi:hypothetical protein